METKLNGHVLKYDAKTENDKVVFVNRMILLLAAIKNSLVNVVLNDEYDEECRDVKLASMPDEHKVMIYDYEESLESSPSDWDFDLYDYLDYKFDENGSNSEFIDKFIANK